MPLASGTKLGPFEILSALGAGGMGEVYRARDSRLSRDVAIKVLAGHLSSNPDLKARFEREARAISALSHPHICHLYDVGSQDGTDYLVMELLEGQPLSRRLEKGPLPLREALQCGIGIAEALETAHKSGIVHRDLKPGNVMLTKSGAKLLDFGLAKPVEGLGTMASGSAATMSQPLTQEGKIIGTFRYMAPEQVQGHEADARTDIFAFGAVLYEMLTGKRAFEGKSQISVMSAILEKEPEPVSAVQPLTPPALDHVIHVSNRGVLVYQAGGSGKPSELLWLAPGNKPPTRATESRDNYRELRLSPDGRKLAVTIGSPHAEVWIYDLTRGVKTRLTFTNAGFANTVVWAPDGRRVAVSEIGSSGSKIYLKEAGGSGKQEDLVSGGTIINTVHDWSGDGQYLLYAATVSPAPMSLYVLPMTGERKPKLFLTSGAFPILEGHFSPDGKWVAYLPRRVAGSRPMSPVFPMPTANG
jgi:serine/threonine protein kinase